MCGIAGVAGAAASARVEAMLDAMHHRGPDDRGLVSHESATLGMTRLAIIDLSPTGHQPMTGPDGLVDIVYNGEIYNYRELRAQLAAGGWCFRSQSDTEAILALYYRRGDRCAVALRGMFAFAIYDRRGGRGRERWLLARDHLGIKPLLYTETPHGLVFASELKALLASGLVAADIDPVGLRDLLARGSVTQPRTILSDVQALPPAHRLVIEGGRHRVERYWSLAVDRVPNLRDAPYAEIVERVESVLCESVAAQMVADVPVGAFLSGGVDSSLLVAMMARHHRGPLATYSVGFPAEGRHLDETDDALVVARFLGTTHKRVEISSNDALAALPGLGMSLDQPSVDGLNAYFVSKAAANDLKVAISGTGGDELFGGYPWFRAVERFEARRSTSPARRILGNAAARMARRRGFDRFRHGRYGGLLARVRSWDFVGTFAEQYGAFGLNGAWRLLHPSLREEARAGEDYSSDIELWDELPRAGAVDRATALCLRGYTQNQLLRDIDAVSMAHSLEVRVPFLDTAVIDLALAIPAWARLAPERADAPPDSYRASGVKRVLLDVARKFLPPDFDIRGKRGFTMPFDTWLRGPLREICHDLLSGERVAARRLLDTDAVSETLARFEAGVVHWSHPWLLLTLELWFQQVLDRPGSR
jgi:asparagine synthase (glutamine-hydrolysing)